MKKRIWLIASLLIAAGFSTSASSALARGFGGGFHGGGGGFHGGGGYHAPAGGFHAPAGGMNRNMGHSNFNLGNFNHASGMSGMGGAGSGFHLTPSGAGSFAGGMNRGGMGSANLGGMNRGGLNHSGMGGAARPGAGGAGTVGMRGAGAGGMGRDSFGDHFGGAAPSRGALNSFLGLPSEEGMHGLGAAGAAGGDRLDVNHGSYTGPRGGEAHGTTVTGPRGNTVGRGAAEGPRGGEVAGRGVEGAGGAAAGQAVARGPRGGVAAAEGVRGPAGNAAARGAAVGPYGGVAAGYGRVGAAGRYATATAVRGNYRHWDYYDRAWYGRHVGAWYPAAWGWESYWLACSWANAASYYGYGETQPVYYDYGNNVVYEDNSVVVNGQSAGTAEEYYNSASQLASTGAKVDAPADGDWLPLGVFALAKNDATKSDVVIQLAINKAGVLRGNYTDTVTDKTQVVHGSLDRESQRVAFTVGENATTVLETGLYNLTKDEAPCLIQFSKDRTEQWLLVRLQQPDADKKK